MNAWDWGSICANKNKDKNKNVWLYDLLVYIVEYRAQHAHDIDMEVSFILIISVIWIQ